MSDNWKNLVQKPCEPVPAGSHMAAEGWPGLSDPGYQILPHSSLDNVLLKTQYFGANQNAIKTYTRYHEKNCSIKTDVRLYLKGNYYLILYSSQRIPNRYSNCSGL